MRRWKDGDMMLKRRRFNISPTINRLFSRYQRLCDDARKDWNDPNIAPYTITIDTHARSGEFGELLDLGLRKIKKEKLKQSRWVCPDEEYFTVYVMFGSEKQIINKLNIIINKLKELKKDMRFQDTISLKTIRNYNKKFKGKEFSYLSHYNFRNKNNDNIDFYNVIKNHRHADKSMPYVSFSNHKNKKLIHFKNKREIRKFLEEME